MKLLKSVTADDMAEAAYGSAQVKSALEHGAKKELAPTQAPRQAAAHGMRASWSYANGAAVCMECDAMAAYRKWRSRR